MILFILLSAALVDSQICENEQIAVYGEKVQNATKEVINIVQSTVLQVPIESLQDGGTDSTTLYLAITAAHNVTTSEQGFTNFVEAMDTITDAYLTACYGLETDKPSLEDAPDLLNTFLTLLTNHSNITMMRQLYGKLLCLNDFTNSDRRKRNAACANVPDVKSLYDCLDPEEIGCIFYLKSYCNNADPSDLKEAINCIGFIVDTSGSMGEEIAAVRDIVYYLIAAHENRLTLCYILVTFSNYGK